MKILLVSPFTDISGSAIRFWNMAYQFSLMGHDVIYVERSANKKQPPAYPNITYYTSPKLDNLFLDIFISFLFNTFILLKHLNIDIFYALKPAPNNCVPALLCKMLRKRIILDIDDLDYGYFPKGFKYNISKLFFDYFPKHFETITFHTKNLGTYLTDNLKIKNEKLYFLKQGISNNLLNYNSDKTKKKPFSIVYIATLGLTTDIDDLFPLFKNICESNSKITITIIGDGPKKSSLARQIKEIGLSSNVNFIGRIDHCKVPDILTQHNIGLIYMRPSFTNSCRAILKIREYLAQKLVVVGNDSGDALLFKDHAYIENSIPKMQERLNYLLKQPYIEPNERGFKFIKDNFKWETIINDFYRKKININNSQ